MGQLGDGWLASFLVPGEAAAARRQIAEAADAAGREIEDDHYGTNLLVVPPGADPDEVTDAHASIAPRRPDLEPDELVVPDWKTARARIAEFVEAGLTKFVVRPAVAPHSWDAFLDGVATELTTLEN